MREEAFIHEDAFYHEHPDRYDPYAGRSTTFKLFYEENYTQLLEEMKSLGLAPTSRVLSIGSGPGNPDLERILAETTHVVGLDVSLRALSLCRRRFPETMVTLASAHALPFPDESFDFVLFVLTVHHLTGQHLSGLERTIIHYALDEVRRVLKREGVVVCLEPNVLFPSTLVIYPINSVMQRLKPGWRGLVPSERNIAPFQLKSLFQRHGFRKFEYRATTFANSKFPEPFFRWIMAKEGRLRRGRLFRNFGVFTLAWARR